MNPANSYDFSHLGNVAVVDHGGSLVRSISNFDLPWLEKARLFAVLANLYVTKPWLSHMEVYQEAGIPVIRLPEPGTATNPPEDSITVEIPFAPPLPDVPLPPPPAPLNPPPEEFFIKQPWSAFKNLIHVV